MKQLVRTIEETIGEVFKENESLSDIDLAYFFLLGVARSTVKDLLEGFKPAAIAGSEWYTSRRKGLESRFKNRQVPDKLVKELTQRTLELLEHKIERAGDNLDHIDINFLDEQQYFEAGYYDFSKVIVKKNEGKLRMITGRLINISYRISKKKEFAYLTVEDYKKRKLTVLVSSTFYKSYAEDLKNCKGKYLGLSGKITYDNFRKTLIIKAYELDIIKGYHIPRVPIKTFKNE